MSFHPQTPQSPSQSSPNSTDPLSSVNTSMTSITSTLPTPAHSVNGLGHDGSMGEDSPQKRKRTLDDLGGREQKKVHVDDGSLSIADLHMDVGEPYLLCRRQHKPSFPRLTDDLFVQFGLIDVADSVGRYVADGSQKLKPTKVRASYRGYVSAKDGKSAMAGKFEGAKRKWESTDGFRVLYGEPEDSWYATKVKTKEVWRGLSDDSKADLSAALTFAKGPLGPFDDTWNKGFRILVEEGTKPKKANGTPAAGTPLHPAVSQSSVRSAVSTPVHPAVQRSKAQQPTTVGDSSQPRPQRSIKKRSYGDNSFEGYGEGYPDDDASGDPGYSTAEGDGPGQKRRKKNPGPAQFPSSAPGPVRQQSYGPGMVGA